MPVNEASLLSQGITITIISMVVVFSFFTIMIISMNVMAKLMPILAKISPEVEPKEQNNIKKSNEQFDEIALVVAAVKNRFKG